jgi:hypothetical protein
MTLIQTFRDTIRQISPPWLRRGNNEKFAYALGVVIDDFGDALVAGLKLRFPGVYSDESLPLLGRERRIRRGRTESTTIYAVRLNRWLTDHRRRGGPYALLAQLYAHYAPNNFPIELIYRSGRRFSMDVAGAVVRDDTTWTFDAVTASKWARWLLVFHWPIAIDDSGEWDSDPALWDDDATVWDSNLTPSDIEDLRLLPKEWNAAHALGTVQLIDSGGFQIHFSIG